jgi:hypothetical protein
MRAIRQVVLAAGLCALAAGAQAQAPQKPAAQKPAAAKPPARVYYDIYEPLQRPRLKRESCMKGEDSVGAYCVKKCNPSYVLRSDIRPMRCQGTNPLPPGVLPGPIRSDVGIQPMPPQPDRPPLPKPGA